MEKNDKNTENEYEGISREKSENTIKTTDVKLNSEWIIWYASRKEKDHHIIYGERLIKLASFSTLQSFFQYYMYLRPVWEIERNIDIAFFKVGYKPLWESCPHSGCWFIRFKKSDDPYEIDSIWERLLFAIIGEQMEEPHILGAVLSIRGRETIIELWVNYFKYEQIKNSLFQKMKTFLNLEKNITLYFKDNEQSLYDKSTIRNAETYSLPTRKGSK